MVVAVWHLRAAISDAVSDALFDSSGTPSSAPTDGTPQHAREYLTRHGVLTPAQLFESPFTEITAHGPKRETCNRSSTSAWAAR
jgi:hypothetical protein